MSLFVPSRSHVLNIVSVIGSIVWIQLHNNEHEHKMHEIRRITIRFSAMVSPLSYGAGWVALDQL